MLSLIYLVMYLFIYLCFQILEAVRRYFIIIKTVLIMIMILIIDNNDDDMMILLLLLLCCCGKVYDNGYDNVNN